MTSTEPAGSVAGLPARIARAHAEHHRRTGGLREPDVGVDDAVTGHMLAPHLARAGLFGVLPTVLALLWLLLDYLAAMSSPSETGTAIQSLLGLVVAVLYLTGIAAFLAPAREPIAEHARVVEGGARAATDAVAWARESARARRIPATAQLCRVGGVEVLEFRQHAERAMLLVQPYGEDLYVGWTMWRSRSPALLLAHFLRDTFGRLGSGPRLSAELRAASARAMRETVHSLAREAATLAVSVASAPRAAPVERDTAPTGPAAVSPDPVSRARPGPALGPAHPPAAAADAPWLRTAARVPADAPGETGSGENGSGENGAAGGWGPPPGDDR